MIPLPSCLPFVLGLVLPQALVYGDNRPFNVALVFPDWGLVRQWAEGKAGAEPSASMEDLASMEAVRNLIAGEIALSLDGFKKFEVSSGFGLVWLPGVWVEVI